MEVERDGLLDEPFARLALRPEARRIGRPDDVEVDELAYEGVQFPKCGDRVEEGGAARGEARVRGFEDQGDGTAPGVDEGGKSREPRFVRVEAGRDVVRVGRADRAEEVPGEPGSAAGDGRLRGEKAHGSISSCMSQCSLSCILANRYVCVKGVSGFVAGSLASAAACTISSTRIPPRTATHKHSQSS